MHELLFHRQQALEDQDLVGYADQLGLDRQRLLADLDSQTAVLGAALAAAIKET